jgi:hypothetical protein
MLLPALVKCHGRILELNAIVATDEDAVFLLHTVLSKYTIFITVRERVSKSLAIITATGSEVLLVPNSPFAAAWSDFKSLAVQRLQIQERPVHIKNEILCTNFAVCHLSFLFDRNADPFSIVPQNQDQSRTRMLQPLPRSILLLQSMPDIRLEARRPQEKMRQSFYRSVFHILE